ncbi:hypothetical protein F5Y15DRAFT_416040 [Xylariaceae sp. FL0016]|nr:hypothetical protein F5Y15DRAFT_416040 [Xylariaceae sp. FL0016]
MSSSTTASTPTNSEGTSSASGSPLSGSSTCSESATSLFPTSSRARASTSTNPSRTTSASGSFSSASSTCSESATSSGVSTTTASSSSVSATPTCINTTAPNSGLVDNGDFEVGLSPWSIDLVDLFSTEYSLDTPGYDNSCSAFKVSMQRNQATDFYSTNLRLTTDLLFTAVDSKWTITYWVRFQNRNAAYVTLFANDVEILTTTGFDVNGAQWTPVTVSYTAQDRLLRLLFSFDVDRSPSNAIWIDQVSIVPNITAVAAAPEKRGWSWA